MGFITIFLLALGLCFDSFAVSLSSGMCRCERRGRDWTRFSIVLALFQGVMPFIGWAVAINFVGLISRVDHWVAFGLLAFLGIKMIRESFDSDDERSCSPFQFRRTCVLGLATSIDALVAGVALAMVSIEISRGDSQIINMLIASGVITLVTFAACIVGLTLGKTAKNHLGGRAEFLGGAILILIGLKVLLDHLFFS